MLCRPDHPCPLLSLVQHKGFGFVQYAQETVARTVIDVSAVSVPARAFDVSFDRSAAFGSMVLLVHACECAFGSGSMFVRQTHNVPSAAVELF